MCFPKTWNSPTNTNSQSKCIFAVEGRVRCVYTRGECVSRPLIASFSMSKPNIFLETHKQQRMGICESGLMYHWRTIIYILLNDLKKSNMFNVFTQTSYFNTMTTWEKCISIMHKRRTTNQ